MPEIFRQDKIHVDECSTRNIDKENYQMNAMHCKAVCMLMRTASDRRGIANRQTLSNVLKWDNACKLGFYNVCVY